MTPSRAPPSKDGCTEVVLPLRSCSLGSLALACSAGPAPTRAAPHERPLVRCRALVGLRGSRVRLQFDRSSLSSDIGNTHQEHPHLAKPNYQFAKRQKDLAKKRKKEEKRQRRLDKTKNASEETSDRSPDPLETTPME